MALRKEAASSVQYVPNAVLFSVCNGNSAAVWVVVFLLPVSSPSIKLSLIVLNYWFKLVYKSPTKAVGGINKAVCHRMLLLLIFMSPPRVTLVQTFVASVKMIIDVFLLPCS